MNKIFLFFIFSFLSISVYAQNRVTAITENNQKLLVIAENYANNNPSDIKAADLVLKSTQVESAISNYMNKISNGGYANMGTKQKIEYAEVISENDAKLREMNSVLKKSYKVNHEYFSKVDVGYKTTLENFKTALISGQYGPGKRRKIKKRNNN